MSQLFTYDTLHLPAESQFHIQQRIVNAGLTPRVVGRLPSHPQSGPGAWQIQVAEEVTFEGLKEAINGSEAPQLSADVEELRIPNDGESYGRVTISDSRMGRAAGRTCVVTIASRGSGIAMRAQRVEMDANGCATFDIGPSPASGWIGSKVMLQFDLEDKSALPCAVSAQFVAA